MKDDNDDDTDEGLDDDTDEGLDDDNESQVMFLAEVR